jgi:Predicted membrane protein
MRQGFQLTWKSAAILPETTTKEPVPSIATTGVSETLVERPKTAESTDVPAVVAPVPPAVPVEADAAHFKRPYENPIFNNEENLKPHKMPKTDEEALGASVVEDKKTIETLAGAGPASTAALTTPEPVPVQAGEPKATETPVVAEAPKAAETPVVAEAPKIAEEKKVAETPVVAEEKVEAPKVVAETPKVAEEKVAETPVVAEAPKIAEEKKVAETPVVAEAPKAVQKTAVESAPKSTPAQTGASKPASSPEAIAAANAAILSSKGDRAAVSPGGRHSRCQGGWA